MHFTSGLLSEPKPHGINCYMYTVKYSPYHTITAIGETLPKRVCQGTV